MYLKIVIFYYLKINDSLCIFLVWSLSLLIREKACDIQRPGQLRQIVKWRRKNLEAIFRSLFNRERGSAKKREKWEINDLELTARVLRDFSSKSQPTRQESGRIAGSSYKEARSVEAKPIWMRRERLANEYVQPRTWSERQMQVGGRKRESAKCVRKPLRANVESRSSWHLRLASTYDAKYTRDLFRHFIALFIGRLINSNWISELICPAPAKLDTLFDTSIELKRSDALNEIMFCNIGAKIAVIIGIIVNVGRLSKRELQNMFA